MKLQKLVCLLAVGLLYWSCSQEEEMTTTELDPVYAKTTIKDPQDIIDGVNGGVVGTSTLRRNKNGININFKVDGLIPGHAYTIWWVIWNKPENCDTPYACGEPDFGNPDAVMVEVLYAAGHVVGNSGKGHFSAHLNEWDSSGTINPLFGLDEYGGLHDAEKAEVHVVLRSHGPAVPGIVNEQINSYGGGCDDISSFDPFTEIPDEVGECGDIYFSIHLSPCTP